ncbi:MAG TPA: DUF1697 domain-containing protein [Candidatus Saccharimonadales bacterium]|nr:DUF1697 domain-containing protein [Candidatus Saccharimonadales bacterium]
MKYAALLRGIGPANPNMHGGKLAGVMQDLGFSNVQSVISSGNVVFESDSGDITQLEATIQAAWPERLGFTSMTIVRSQAQLEALAAQDPYKGLAHSRESYLLVTFFKTAPEGLTDNYYSDLGVNALCSVIDTTTSKTPDFMGKLERQFSKDITSRTWLTIQRILAKMGISYHV